VPEAQDLLGDLLAEAGDWAGAEVAYQAAIDTADPTWAPVAQLDLARSRAGRGESGGVRELLEAAAGSRNPQVVPEAQDLLGDLLAEAGDWAGAEVAYQAAIDTADPTWAPVAEFDLALCRWQRGDTGEALERLERASGSSEPGVRAAAYGALGDLLAALGEGIGGEAAYEAAVAAGDHERGGIAAERLAHLRRSDAGADGVVASADRGEPAEAAARARRDWG
jgi:predicted negative regulator of RcsB-dependent stress response